MENPADTPVINANVAQLDAAIAAAPGAREPFTLELVREWHRAIHAGAAHIPRLEYVGSFRGEGSLHLRTYGVGFGSDPRTGGKFHGAAPDTVAGHLAAFEADMVAAVVKWDGIMPTLEDVTLSRLNTVIEDVAVLYATWIRIHPFADGNGRTARVFLNWVMARYGQPLVLPGRPVSDRDGLVAATAPAIPEATSNVRPLVNHLRRRLKSARAAAAAATP